MQRQKEGFRPFAGVDYRGYALDEGGGGKGSPTRPREREEKAEEFLNDLNQARF